MVFSCCVPCCLQKKPPMHRFPVQKSLCDIWVQNIGRTDLKGRAVEALRKGYRVCDRHFNRSNRYVGQRRRSTLNFNAIPTENLSNNNFATSTGDIEAYSTFNSNHSDTVEIFSSPKSVFTSDFVTSTGDIEASNSGHSDTVEIFSNPKNVFTRDCKIKTDKELKTRRGILCQIKERRVRDLSPKSH